jgi:hypothetical protein
MNCSNTLDNERIVFRNGALKEYLNLRNNTIKCTYTNAFFLFYYITLDNILLSVVLVLHVSA